MSNKIFIIIGLFIISNAALAQDNSNLMVIVKNIIKKRQDTAKIYYRDSMLTNREFNEMMNIWKRKRFTGYSFTDKKEVVFVSAEERRYLVRELKTRKLKVWDGNFFNNSQCIKLDSVWSTIKKLNFNTTGELHRTYRDVWNFFMPIVFRNGIMAMIYYNRLCGGSCGEFDYCFYKKVNGFWKKSFSIYGGEY